MITTHILTDTTYLIMGGARSGKSSYAEKIAIARDQPVTYIATATIYDAEMEDRVSRHQSDRPAHWKTVEEPISLANAVLLHDANNQVILIDCLTMWVNNLLMLEDEKRFEKEIDNFLQSIPKLQGTLILVSNEVGMGIIPMGALTRKFVDESGLLHQRLGDLVSNVILMVAGQALEIKGNTPL